MNEVKSLANDLFVGLDIGTSSVKAVAFSEDGARLAIGRAGLSAQPATQQVEQDPQAWWKGSISALRLMAEQLGTDVKRIGAIGLTGQCPTFTLLDRSGNAVTPGITYQDNRAVAETALLIQRLGFDRIHYRTGMNPTPFYVLPKLMWLKNRVSLSSATRFTLAQVRDFVGLKLTGTLLTDQTHAACTLLYDYHTGAWAHDWLCELGLDHVELPDIRSCVSLNGYLTQESFLSTGLPVGIPVAVGAADSLCAAYATVGDDPSSLCDITGTSTCLHLTVPNRPYGNGVNLYPHIIEGQSVGYAEVGINTTAVCVEWAAQLFGRSVDDVFEQASKSEPGANGLLFFPHLADGERDNESQVGGYVGVNLCHREPQFARSILEGVSFAIKQRIEGLTQAGLPIARIVSCGGGARSAVWNQIKADVLQMDVYVPTESEVTALGAAMIAAKAVGTSIELVSMSYDAFHPDRSLAATYGLSYQAFQNTSIVGDV